MKRFKIGIIGAGHIAIKMASTLNAMQSAEPYGIAARDRSKAEAFAAAHNITKAYGSYEELADDPDVDLIYIATPHSLHYAHARMCLERGKAVLCEKAFTANATEAEELIRLSQSKGVFLAEAIWTRYMPFSRTIAEIAASGAIGTPHILSAHLGYPVGTVERILRPELGGGALLDLGVYTLNFASMCFGADIARIDSACTLSETGVDLQESITLRFADGRMAILQATALCANDRQGIICGDKGYIVVDNINNPLHATLHAPDHTVVRTYDAPPQITGFEYQVQACIDAIGEGRIETPYMPHSESLRIMRIMDGLRRQWGVTFPNDAVRGEESR